MHSLKKLIIFVQNKGVHMFKRPLLISDIHDLKLDYDNDGVQAYWQDLLQELENRPTGGVLISDIREGVGGTYTNKYSIDCVTFNKKYTEYDEKNHILKLQDLGLQTLIHEGAHFLHIGVAEGKYSAPCYKDCKPFKMDRSIDCQNKETGRTNRYMCEFEAGYRAVVSAVMYDMGIEDLVIACNLRNLLNYAKECQSWLKELYDKRDETDKLLTDKIDKFVDAVCLDYMKDKKFVDIEDIDSVKIELNEQQKKELKQIVK